MDFDLFELEDDDEIFTAASAFDPSQNFANNNNNVLNKSVELLTSKENENSCLEPPEFQCCGEDSHANQFSADGFVKSQFLEVLETLQTNYAGSNCYEKCIKAYQLSQHNFNWLQMQDISVAQYLFGNAFFNIQDLASSVQGSSTALLHNMADNSISNPYTTRHEVTKLLHILLFSNTTEWPIFPVISNQIHILRKLLNSISHKDNWKQIYFANSCKGNDSNVPAYHLLHGLLEWKLIDLCILQQFVISSKETMTDSDLNVSIFINQLQQIFDDLLNCSLFLFVKKKSAELLYNSAFPCVCFKEFWLILQLLMNVWSKNMQADFTFWQYFNKALEKFRNHLDLHSLTALTFVEFSNWMLHSLAKLFGFTSKGYFEGATYNHSLILELKENHELAEKNTLNFLANNPNEEQLRIYICLLSPILLEWWSAKANIPMDLWEYYHKRLNSSFYVSGAAPCNLAVTCCSGMAYLQKYRDLLGNNKSYADANLSSYTLFIILLGKCLKKLLKTSNKNQAQKILGRIYAKFSLQKFLTLNEMGIHHLIELFLVLCLSGDFVNDLAAKLRDKLLSITLDKIAANRQTAVTKGHVALLILYAEHKMDLSDYVNRLLQQLNSIRNEISVCKILAEGLLDILQHADDFERGESLLIDAWLPNFLQNSTPAEQDRTLQCLHGIFEKMQRLQQPAAFTDVPAHSTSHLLKALNVHILPFLKQQYLNGFSNWLPQLAADFCLFANNNDEFQKLFNFFLEAQNANRQALPQFLLKLLESCSAYATSIRASTIIHVWLKSLVQLNALNEEVQKLSKYVVQLPEFQKVSNLNEQLILQAKEPLCVFIAAVGKTYDAASYNQKCQIADCLNSYLTNFERWMLQPDLKMEKSEIAFRFYSFLAIVIYNCPQIVYAKSKLNCFFHISITRFVLTTSILMGKPPEGKMALLVHKVFPVLLQGIGKLNFKTDSYINKTLTDLIQKWTPHFKISPNAKLVARPFIQCLQADNYDLSRFVFEKLTALFLSTQRRQADPNACLVITIFQEVVQALNGNASNDVHSAQRLEILMKATSLCTLEHIMMVDELVPSRALLLEYFRLIIHSSIYQSSQLCQELLKEHLKILTKKHLAYYTFFYFELLMKFVQISADLIQSIMEFLKQEIQIVEQKRGETQDNRIRACLQKLENSIRTTINNMES